MPIAPVAYEVRSRRSQERPETYMSRLRKVLSGLGSTDPDADIEATGDYARKLQAQGIDPGVAGALVYATARHRHPPTSVLSEEVKRSKWTFVSYAREVELTLRRMGMRPGEADVAVQNHGALIDQDFKEGRSPWETAEKISDHEHEAEKRMRGEPSLEDRPALRWAEVWWKDPADAKRFAELLEKINSEVVATADNRIVTTNATGADIAKVIRKHKWRAPYSLTSSVDKAAENPLAEGPCTRPHRTPVDGECAALAKSIGPIRSDRELYKLCAPRMKKEPQEVFYVVCVDVHGELVGFTEVARGQVSQVHVEPEQVLQEVLSIKPRPTGYAVCHNHPSGKSSPSPADRKLTEDIKRAGAVACPNVAFMDHLVIGGGESRDYYSFADRKLKRA